MSQKLDQPTRWSVVWRAGHGDTREMRLAREELASIYWQPVFLHVRRLGMPPDRAEDLTQGFFEYLIERNLFAHADRDRGRLRSYFFIILRRYLINEWRRDRKRLDHEVPLEEAPGPESFGLSPDREFERQWALATVHRALESTEAAYTATHRAELFAQLRPLLTALGDDDEIGYAGLAAATGKSPGALRVAVFRLRRDFRAHLASLVARTLDHPTPEAVLEEIRDLLRCL